MNRYSPDEVELAAAMGIAIGVLVGLLCVLTGGRILAMSALVVIAVGFAIYRMIRLYQPRRKR
jgi:hypothetical protein